MCRSRRADRVGAYAFPSLIQSHRLGHEHGGALAGSAGDCILAAQDLALATVLVTAVSCAGEPTTVTTPTSLDTTQTTAATTTSTTRPASTTTTLPGEPFDIGPREGDVVAVVGVAHDDVLNVRAHPGVDAPVVGSLEPLAADLVALGRSRLLPDSIWLEVEADGVTGWVNSSFVAFLGRVEDVTSTVVAEAGGIPAAETMLDLGLAVAEAMASEDPPSKIVMTVAPTWATWARSPTM